MSDYSDDAMSETYDSDGSGDFEDFQDNDSDYDVPISKDKDKGKSTSVEYRSLTTEGLQQLMDDDIRRVASITGLEYPIASAVLQFYRWNEDRLLEKFMESPSSVLEAAGEPNADVPTSSQPSPRPKKRARLTPVEYVCGICYDIPDPQDVRTPRCGHSYCKECWGAYVTSKVKDEGQCLFQCMNEDCKAIMDESFISSAADETCRRRYKELLRQSYVIANSNLRFCPHPSCTETVSCPGGRGSLSLTIVPIVRCGESHTFCFGCGMDSDHRPLICKWISMWQKNAREDAGTSQWIKANTRTCPKCENNIEKAGGCNRILCRHCNYQFCWMCMKNWDVHGYNDSVCSTWKEPEPDAEKTAAQANLEKWLFYFDRFNNHELSAKLDQELVERTAEKMLEVQRTSQLSWIESKFMEEAVDELTRCRVSLKWSYTMAYFLSAGNQKHIFEDLQADLEKAVEALSQMLEEPIEDETVKSLRQRMMDKTVYVKGRHEILLNDTAAGLLEGRWEWIDETN